MSERNGVDASTWVRLAIRAAYETHLPDKPAKRPRGR
mgnify:CR=1 FL=1